MDQLKLLNAVERGDEYYREQWSLYYAERRRLLQRVFRLAGALGVLFALCWWTLEKHPSFGYVLAVPTSILLLAVPAQWFIFVWRMRTWTSAMRRVFFHFDSREQSIWQALQALRAQSTEGIGAPRSGRVTAYALAITSKQPAQPATG